MIPACISIMSFAIRSPAGLCQDLHSIEQIEGSVRGMFPRDGKDWEFGEFWAHHTVMVSSILIAV